MKKLLIPATLLLIAACSLPFMKENSSKKNISSNATFASTTSTQNQNETTRAFHPQFTALNIPGEMKQNYRINPNAGQIIVGKSGSIISIPDHAFQLPNGEFATEKVKLQLVEGIETADILKMNLGTMSDQGILETGGMISVNVFSDNGDTLHLAAGKELEVEIPTNNLKQGMKLWDGIVQNDGSVSWTNPQPLKENLRPIPVADLDTNTKAKAPKREQDQIGWRNQRDIRTARVKVISESGWGWWSESNGTWSNSFVQNGINLDSNIVAVSSTDGKSIEFVNITDEKFANTNIATAEFRSRLPFINQACDARIMSCYTSFPYRALWKSDEAAADTLDKEGCPLADLFHQFANLKQGKVDPKDVKTTEALSAAREKAIQNYSHKMAVWNKQNEMYNSFSFGMKKLGWANVDRLCNPGGGNSFFNVNVKGANDTNDVHVTLVVPNKGLFINGYKRPNGNYSFTHGEMEQTAAYPKGEEAFILVKGGDAKNFKYAFQKIVLGTNQIESVIVHSGTIEQLDREMGNIPSPKKDEPEKLIDDWYTKSLRSGSGCLCGMFGVASK